MNDKKPHKLQEQRLRQTVKNHLTKRNWFELRREIKKIISTSKVVMKINFLSMDLWWITIIDILYFSSAFARWLLDNLILSCFWSRSVIKREGIETYKLIFRLLFMVSFNHSMEFKNKKESQESLIYISINIVYDSWNTHVEYLNIYFYFRAFLACH